MSNVARIQMEGLEHSKASNEAPFFIVGIGRSGTTLLRLMLHNHPRIAIPYETHFITDYLDKISNYGTAEKIDKVAELVKDICEEPMVQFWDYKFNQQELVAALPQQPSLQDVVQAFYQAYIDSKGKQRWGDKSDYMNRMDQILEIFPNAQFIHIYRDGRDVARSVLKLDWGITEILTAAEWWHEHVRDTCAEGVKMGPERYTEIKFEQLLETPEEELKRICAFLGEDYASEMLDYHKNVDSAIPDSRNELHRNNSSPIKRNRSYAWKEHLTKSDVDLFSQVASETLEHLGYEVPESTTPGLVLKFTKYKNILKRKLNKTRVNPQAADGGAVETTSSS